MVFQIQLAHRNDVLPVTRDYMAKCEKALEIHAVAHAPQLVKKDRNEPAPKRAPKRARSK